MKNRKNIVLHITFTLVLAVSLCFSNTLVYAVDSVKSLTDESSGLKNELSDLNAELNTICNELDNTILQMEQITTEITATKGNLADAKANEQKQYEAMKLRIRYIYETGNSTFLELLFTANSMADFLNKADFISNISDYDREMLTSLVAIQKDILQKESLLETEQSQLLTLKEELSKKQDHLQNKIASTSGELSQYTDRLNRAATVALAAEELLKIKVSAVPPTESPAPEDDYEETAPPAPPNSIPATTSEVNLLAALIECEAGGGSYEGLVAVGAVVINRVNNSNYPNSITNVIKQPGQFSPYASGKLAKVVERGATPICFDAANDALSGSNPIGGCLSFRAASTGHSGIIMGGNVFF
ncbi:MAG: cell wall hydrolase [Lachnospiraceae bacterium]